MEALLVRRRRLPLSRVPQALYGITRPGWVRSSKARDAVKHAVCGRMLAGREGSVSGGTGSRRSPLR